MVMIEEMEVVIAPLTEDAKDFWQGFAVGVVIATAVLCGGA
jgi:hypothetical protein